MRTLKVLTSTLFAALVLVTCVDYAASAATGKPFILGKINKANTVTTVKRTTPGPALKVTTTSSSAAPLTVNGRGKVANLNADTVDGIDSSALKTRSYVWRREFTSTSFAGFQLNLPVGSYLISYSNAFWDLPNASEAECWVLEESGSAERYTGYMSLRHPTVASTSYFPALSGSGLVTKTAANKIIVGCQSPHLFHTIPTIPMEIVATPTTALTGPTATRLP